MLSFFKELAEYEVEDETDNEVERGSSYEEYNSGIAEEKFRQSTPIRVHNYMASEFDLSGNNKLSPIRPIGRPKKPQLYDI